jgi:hypothetical protein
MSIGMNGHFNVNPLEIPASRQSIPPPYCFPNGFVPAGLLNPIMADLASHYFARLRKLVIPADRHEGTRGDSIRCLEHNGACAFASQKIFHGFGETVKKVLRAATGPTSRFGLLKVHGGNIPPPAERVTEILRPAAEVSE